MPSAFDQFDSKKPNAFDQFDGPSRVNRPRPQQERGVQHPEFDASGISGYDPETSMVEHGANNGWVDKLGAFSASVLDGVPIAGPALLEGAHQLAARTNPFSDKNTDQLLYEGRQATDRAVRDNPYTSLAGNVTGATAATLPAIAAAPTAFGAGGGGIATRSVISGLTGSGIGATDAAVRRGGETDATKTGAFVGGLAGLAGPAAGNAIGAGYRVATDWLAQRGISRIADMTPKAWQLLRSAIEADGLDPTQIQQRLQQLGPDATLADIGPNLQQTASAIVTMPGEGRSIVQNAMRGRDANANSRIRAVLDETLGPAAIPSDIAAGIEASQRALSPSYGAALQHARPVRTDSIARFLDRETSNLRGDAQRGVARVRQMLNRVGTEELDTNPAVLLETRKAVDGMLETVVDSNARHALATARQAIDDHLRWSVPGIKDIDAQYAELARQRDALGRGQQVLESGRTAPRPSELMQEVQDGALPQGTMIGPSAASLRLRDGARAEIERIVGTNANDRVALQRIVKGEGDWNPQRLATLFGEERAGRILRVLDSERTFADTSNFVTRNSATAARMEATEALKGETSRSGIREGYMYGGVRGAMRSAAVTRAEKIMEALRQNGADVDMASLARSISSPRNQQIVQALMRNAGPMIAPAQIANIARALLMGPSTTAAGP